MYQTNSYYPQSKRSASYPQPVVPPMLKGRPVASIEEARAMSFDFDGSIFYFPDLANKRIYTKQINMDGTATLNMYELKEVPVQNTQTTDKFVTREEFEAALAKLQKDLTPQPQAQESATAPAQTFNF